MSITVHAEIGQALGATTEHIPQWICKGGATTRMADFCVNPFGLSVFFDGASLDTRSQIHFGICSLGPSCPIKKSISAVMLIVF